MLRSGFVLVILLTPLLANPINIGVVLSDDPRDQVCGNLLSDNISWPVKAGVKVNIALFSIPDMSFILNYQLEVAILRDRKLSGVIYSMNYHLALATSFLNIPYIVLKNSESKVPSNAITVTNDYHQMGHAVRDLIKALGSHHSITLIADKGKTKNPYELLLSFPGEPIEFFFCNYSDTKEALRQQMQSLAASKIGVTADIFIVEVTGSAVSDVPRILREAFYAGLATSNQLWIILSLFIKPQLLANFRFANARIVTLATGSRKITNIKQMNDATCTAVARFLAGMASPNPSTVRKSDPSASQSSPHYIIRIDYVSPTRASGPAAFEKVGSWGMLSNMTTRVVELSPRISLRRKSFRVGVFLQDPYFLRLRDGSHGGYIVDLMKVVASKMDVTVDWVILSDARLGSDNSSAPPPNGLIGMLRSGTVDVAGIPMLITKERKKLFDMTTPLHTEGVSLMSYGPTTPINWYLLLRPFDLMVWLTWGVIFLVLVISFFVMETISPNTTHSGKGSYSLPDIVFLTFTSLIITKLRIIPRMFSTRIFVLLLWFASLIMVSSYTANMVPFMMRREKQNVLENFQTLYNARASRRWFWIRDSSIITNMRKSKGEIAAKVVAYAEATWPDGMFEPDMKSAVKRLKADTNQVLIESSTFGRFSATSDCKYVVGKQVMLVSGKGLGVRRGWPLSAKLRETLSTLTESNDLKLIYERWLSGVKCSSSKTLYWQDLLTGFLFLGVGVILSLVVAILERVAKVLTPAVLTCCPPRLRPGKVYEAQVKKVATDGALVGIGKGNRKRFYFVPSNQLNLDPQNITKPVDARRLGIKRKDAIQLKYFGRHPMSGGEYLVRNS